MAASLPDLDELVNQVKDCHPLVQLVGPVEVRSDGEGSRFAVGSLRLAQTHCDDEPVAVGFSLARGGCWVVGEGGGEVVYESLMSLIMNSEAFGKQDAAPQGNFMAALAAALAASEDGSGA